MRWFIPLALAAVLWLLAKWEDLRVAKPSRRPDNPCQTCGRFGGKVVSFRVGTMITSRWVCPHCLDRREDAWKLMVDALEGGIGRGVPLAMVHGAWNDMVLQFGEALAAAKEVEGKG